MNQNNNHIFSILNKINWNFHLIFTYPFSNQRKTTNEAIKLRLIKFFNFFSRISRYLKVRCDKQIFAFSDEISPSEQGHLHALYKLPEKYQGNDQQFISKAKEIWPAALGISPSAARGTNGLVITPINPESYQSKVNYVANIIANTDSFDFLSPEASRIIKRCNSFHDSEHR